MKKFLVLLGICILVLCLTACGALMPSAAPEFASENEMFTYLNGMWATGSGENAEYYIVQDGNVYDVSGSDLFDLMNDLLNDAFTHKGVDGLIALDYQTILTKLGNEKMLGKKSKVQIDPSQGKITMNQGKGTEKSIRVKNDDVCVEYKNVTSRENLTKISETVDFSGERFASLFDDLKKNYTIPAAKFWLTTKEYADSMKDSVVEYPFWKLVSMDEKSEVYSLSIPNRTGTFSVTEDMFTYSEKFTYSTYFGTEELSTLFIYWPTAPGSKLSITDTSSPNPAELILHAAVVTHRFPGAPDSQSLYDTLMKASGSVSSGMKTVEKTISGITYKLYISTDGTGAQIFVDAPEVFKLSDIMKYYKPADRPTQDNTPDNGGSSSGDNSSGSGSSSQQPAECTHNYAQATCTEPQKCTKCGKTTGSALGHKYSEATCTAPKTCTMCGETTGTALEHTYSEATCIAPKTCTMCGETLGFARSHNWENATCTKPETCSYCKKTQGEPAGHWMVFTKCIRRNCDYTDYSSIARSVEVSTYGVPEGNEVTNVTISDTGYLSFTFMEKEYTLFIVQNDESDQYMAYFDCYMNGERMENVSFDIGSELYYNRIQLVWKGIEGYRLHFITKS